VALLSTRAPARCDERGAVYVEFLFAFFPLFVLFLAICQLAFITSARLVVEHAAFLAIRSAIVVLEDDPKNYDGAARGDIEAGQSQVSLETMLSWLDLAELEPAGSKPAIPSPSSFVAAVASALEGEPTGPQHGARMAPIRTAAEMALLLLGPQSSSIRGVENENLAASLPGNFAARLPFLVDYTRAATVVTLHTEAGSNELARGEIARDATLTVKITYVFPCGVPLVSALMCSTLASLLRPTAAGPVSAAPTPSALARRLKYAEAPDRLSQLAVPSARFIVLTAEQTLPNQGAAYDHPDKP
jgi:hypothetical protein